MSNFYQGIPGFGNDQQQLSEQLPQDLSMGVTEETLNPWGNIAGNTNVSQVSGYKRGGKIHIKEKAKRQRHKMASKLRKYGKKGDTILAHINPLEAMILKKLGGSGTINEDTGAPQFFFKGVKNLLRNPGKTISKTAKNPKRTLAEAMGLGSAIFGGPLGGAIGGAARSAIRGDKENPLLGALKGAGYGSAIPAVANWAGQGLSALGAEGVGQGLQDYGTKGLGSWLGHASQLGEGLGGTGLSKYLGMGASQLGAGVSAGDDYPVVGREDAQGIAKALSKQDSESWFDKFTRKTKDSLSDPATLLKIADLGMQYVNKPKAAKEKSPEERAHEAKRDEQASRLTPAELAELEKYDLNRAQASRRIERNKYLPEERIGAIPPRYVKSHTPDEYQKYGRWLSYYDNPNYQGDPVGFKHGGVIEIDVMSLPGGFLDGDTGGLDDAIEALLTDGTHTQPARLADGEYVIDAHTVSMLGDGNSKAGAKKLDKMREAIRFDKIGNKKIPKKAKPLTNYMK